MEKEEKVEVNFRRRLGYIKASEAEKFSHAL
jgi:hypothetical protein